MIPTYEIVEDGKAIKCCVCGLTSYHPEDVGNRYCGKCHVFHDDIHLTIDSEAALDPAYLKALGIDQGGNPNGA